MIRELRTRHRLMTTALAIAVPLLFGFAIAMRKNAPLDRVQAQRFDSNSYEELEFEQLRELPDSVLTWNRHRDDGTLIAVFQAFGDNAVPPDLLAYWSPTSEASNTLPEDAVLLGRCLKFAWWPIPEGRGRVYLYSLAKHRVATSTRVPDGDVP